MQHGWYDKGPLIEEDEKGRCVLVCTCYLPKNSSLFGTMNNMKQYNICGSVKY